MQHLLLVLLRLPRDDSKGLSIKTLLQMPIISSARRSHRLDQNRCLSQSLVEPFDPVAQVDFPADDRSFWDREGIAIALVLA